MTQDEEYDIAFNVILHAGNARELFIEAIREARKGDFEEAKKLMKDGDSELNQAHKIQTDLLQGEARGNKVNFSVIFVHSQDHLTMALTTKELAQEMIDSFKFFYEKGGQII